MRGTRGSKCTETSGRKRQNKEAGECWRGPRFMAHWVLIQNGRHLIKISLRRREKNGHSCSITIVQRAQRVYLFLSQPQSAQAHLFEGRGLGFVIYDNCLPKVYSRNVMMIISGEAHGARCLFSSRGGRKRVQARCFSHSGWQNDET